MTVPPEIDRSAVSDTQSLFERLFSVAVGAFLGAFVGLFLGIGLACFGMTMWLWLVIPLTTATIGGLIGLKLTIGLRFSEPEVTKPSDLSS